MPRSASRQHHRHASLNDQLYRLCDHIWHESIAINQSAIDVQGDQARTPSPIG